MRRISRVIGILALAGMAAGCDRDMPELPEETNFDRPALTPAESKELVHILNARRHDWDRYHVTLPGGADAVIWFQLPAGDDATMLYYAGPAEGQCTMFWLQSDFVGVQKFSKSICDRLDTILTDDSTQK